MVTEFPEERLRFLFESVRFGTMRAASEFFGVAPSSISRQITSLEGELGVTLLEKGRHTATLTDAGRLVVDYYLDRRASRERLALSLQALKDGAGPRISLALGPEIPEGPCLGALEDFRRRHHDAAVSLTTAPDARIADHLQEEKIDFAVVAGVGDDIAGQVTLARLAPLPVRLIVRADHPMANAQSIDLNSLNGQALILPSAGFSLRRAFDRRARETGLNPNVVLSASSPSILAESVLKGMGAAIFPEARLSAWMSTGALRAIAIDEPAFARSAMEIIVKSGRRISTAAKMLVDRFRHIDFAADAGLPAVSG